MTRRLPLRIARVVLGLVLYGLAISLMLRAAIGVSPWDVLSQGISRRTGVPFGLVTNGVGLLVLLLWIPIRERPGLGTVLNVLLIGPSAQLGLWLLPAQRSLLLRVPLFACGLLLLAVATGVYLAPRLGPGPRDGLMTGLVRKTGRPVWLVRGGIELTVTLVGWLLGGDVGIGTLLFALLIGPLVGVTLPLLRERGPEDHGPRLVRPRLFSRAPEPP